MSAVRRYGTPAYRASVPGALQPKRPPRRYSQAELRERRRAGMIVGHYSGDWSLAREIAEVVSPLARRIAAADRPARFAHSQASVPWLAEATHEAVGVIVGWLAEADARVKTAHLAAEPGKRKYAMTTLIDLAQRPALPEVTDAALADSSWAAALTALADGIDGAFSGLLAQAYPPGAPGLRGRESRSEQLARLLGRTIDRAALELERRLDRDEQADHRQTAQTDPRAELAALGINT
ncbi:hypothetical protein [Mycobacterium avium]|uniref:hypothetical protein n=1 Tax=Mycobacterium avium TaxID=1764 RepID=UPI000A0402B5|nr:hypothetical protein [Mycobacterium avium]MDV3291912.1 hypothetical protein [Mycobacterium avium subsp. hominissuis]TXA41421.1 hypothetical protein DKM27_13010 [Mycobacterium tuberculosis variant bovis]